MIVSVEMLPRPLLAMEPSSVSDAKLAYFEGDFETCLEICAKIRIGVVETTSLDDCALVGDERFSILSVAENSAHFDPDRAAALFTRYSALAPVDRMCALAADPRLSADETFIEGVIADARGERDHANACYRKAFNIFREIGYVRRAVTTAHALLKIARDNDLRQYIDTHLAGTTNYVTRSLRAADHAGVRLDEHPTIAALPPSQRDVTSLVCSGLTNKEIAALRNVGEQTIKNMLSKSIFPAFGVTNRAALVSLCLGQAPPRRR